MKLSLVLYFLTILLFQFSSCFMNFPKIIWVYWETDFEQAPLITRVSYEKLTIAAESSNWKVNLVTGKNIKDYITDIQEFNGVVKRGKRQTVQEKSDLLRIWLVQENGGVWIDFACIPYENFDWLTNYTSYQHMIINRIGTNLDDPQMFMLGEGWHQSPLSHYNSDGALVTDEFFGMAIHFIAAKKNTRIMTDWKNKMKSISAMTYNEWLPQFKHRRLFFHNIDRGDVYYSGNIALQSTIQLKQFELDQNLSLFSKRLSVYEHYKIWCIHGEVGPIGLTRPHIFKASDLFFQTRQQVQARAGTQRFFLKLAAYLRQGLQSWQNRTKEYLDRTNKTFQQILREGPNNQECNLHFIVEGSILDGFYKNSKYFSQLRVPIMTVKQRDELRSKCLTMNPNEFVPIYDQSSVGQLVSPQREMFAKDTSIRTRLWVWWETFRPDFNSAKQYYRGPLMVFVFYALSKLLFSKFLKKIVGNSDTTNLSSNQSEAELDENSGRGLSSKYYPSSHLKIYTLLLIVHVSILYLVSVLIFQQIPYQGKFPIYTPIAVMSLLIFLTDYITKRATKMYQLDLPDRAWFVSLNKINLVSRMFFIMYVGQCILMHFHVLYAYAYRDTILVVGMGYLLYVIFYELKRRGLANNKIHDAIVYFGGYLLPRIIVGFLVLIVYWRNPMYLTSGNNYLRLEFINNFRYLFELFAKISVVYILIILLRTFIQSLDQQPANSQSRLGNVQSQRQKCQQSLIFVLATLYWAGTYYNISKVYEYMVESPTSYDHMLYFKYFVIHFAVFEFAMRLRIPETLGIGYKVFLYILAFAYAGLFSYYGFDMIHFMFRQWFYVKMQFTILTFILAFLAMASEVFQNQQNRLETTKKNYQQLEENYEISMSDLKPETDSSSRY